jgi:serine protease DegQ
MRRIWLLFAQTVTVCLAILFAVATLRPDWLRLGSQGAGQQALTQGAPVAQASSMPSFAPAVTLAAPAVVNIYTTKRVNVSRFPLPADPAMRQFFEQMPGMSQQQQTTSLGSGVIVSKRGHVLTNLHVIDGADEILIALRDGRQAPAKVMGADRDSDVAVLKIDMKDLPELPLYIEALPRVGDVVLAIGNPFGVGQTVTMGIVSALGRDGLGINTYENFIQTDAAINPGNSGGALVDAQGRLVGLNTAIYSKTGGSLGIGFAIPAAAVQLVMDQIIEFGFVKRGWLGIEPQDMTAELARAFGLSKSQGVIIAGILRDGPAAKAGLKVGDIVQTMDGLRVDDTTKMMARIAAKAPGEKIKLGVYRSGKTVELEVTAGMRPVQPR